MESINWKIVKHADITFEQLRKIAAIKDQHWIYGIESQIKWMNSNLQPNDMHLLGSFQNNDNLCAYLAMIDVQVELDGNIINAIGLGNVCVSKEIKHNGYGRSLMNELNAYLRRKEIIGVLLCKKSLLDFYELFQWKNISYKNCVVANEQYDKNVMIFSHNTDTTYNNIKINRIF